MKIKKIIFLSLSMPLFLITQNSFSLPVGPEYIEGIASANTLPADVNHQVIIQDKHKAIINWQAFNISEKQITEFQQPTKHSIVLNRVMGNNQSSIHGTLKANGQVWLLNPSGILFGPNSKVDVAGLLATTSNISNRDFLNSQQQYHFYPVHSNNAMIINQGHITVKDSGLVALVAPTVQNSGVISAHVGRIALGAGTEFTVDLYGDNLIYFATGRAVSEVPSEGISNIGRIIADGGTVLLTTSDALKVVDNVINMQGFIQANTVNERNGKIILSASNQKKSFIKITGRLNATGLAPNQKGGNISISGDHVRILDNAKIKASGDIQGGKIHIGGEKQGSGTLPHANAVFISQSVNIIADAKTLGNGGEIIVWSDTRTRCYGSLSAQSGVLGGDGGFIETSGGFIDTQGSRIHVQSFGGNPGTYLWDPYDVTVSTAGQANMTLMPSGFEPTASGANMNSTTVSGLLTSNNVTIRTFNPGGAEPGNITQTGLISVGAMIPASATLSYTAENNIAISNAIQRTAGTGILNVAFNAPGNTTLNSAVNVLQNGGAASITTLGLTGAGPLTVAGLTLVAQSANFSGSVNGITDGSNIGGMAASISTYGPNYAGSSRYFFNGNEFFTSPAPLPPTPTPTPPPGGVIVPANTIIPATDLTIKPTTPTAGDDTTIIETDKSSSATSSSTTNTNTTTTSTTTTSTTSTTTTSIITPDTSILAPMRPIDTTVNTPVTALPVAAPLPTVGPVPVGYDVPIGGVLEPVTNLSSEIPIPNIEDRAGIPNLTVERNVFDKTIFMPPVVVPKSNSIGPMGVNGTDVAVGTAGIGSGMQEPLLKKAPMVFKKAEDMIGASSIDESVPHVPCPEGPNCIPGVDSFNSYHPALH